MIIAPGKRSAARGYRHKMNSSFFPSGLARGAPSRKERKRLVGVVVYPGRRLPAFIRLRRGKRRPCPGLLSGRLSEAPKRRFAAGDCGLCPASISEPWARSARASASGSITGMSRFQALDDYERRFETMRVDELRQWKNYWTRHADQLAPKVRKQAMKRVREIERAIEKRSQDHAAKPCAQRNEER